MNQRIALMVFACCLTVDAAALDPEIVRYDVPKGYKEFDLGDPDLATEDVLDALPDGLKIEVPAFRPGETRYLLVPKKTPGDRFERILIESQPDDGVSTASQLLLARSEYLRTGCPTASTHVAGERHEFMYRAAVSLTHCSSDTASGQGRILFTKAILGGEQVYVAEIEFRYPPFEPGSTPLLETQMEAAFEWLASVRVCRGKRDKECKLPAERIVHAKPRPLAADQAAAAERIETLGNLIRQHDQLAWYGTDELRERNIDFATVGSIGWVTAFDAEQRGRVVFVGGDKTAPVGLYQIDFNGSKPDQVTNLNRQPLAEPLVSHLRARQTAVEALELVCSQKMNSAVFPDPDGSGLLVYWMSSSAELGTIVHGGHTRFKMSTDGTTVLERQALTKSCMFMPKPDPKLNVEYSILTHFVTDLPTEMHVFNSLQHQLPIVVFAPSGTWRVRNGKLERLY